MIMKISKRFTWLPFILSVSMIFCIWGSSVSSSKDIKTAMKILTKGLAVSILVTLLTFPKEIKDAE